jgi:hypothetical protein
LVQVGSQIDRVTGRDYFVLAQGLQERKLCMAQLWGGHCVVGIKEVEGGLIGAVYISG